jgi:splicing factor 3B subunit 1
VPQTPGEAGLPFVKPEDYQFFAALMEEVDESALSKDEANERKIMKLLLKVKNGTPPMRKQALRQEQILKVSFLEAFLRIFYIVNTLGY